MLRNKDSNALRMLFSSHNYVMTTAELTASKLYYADIKQLLDEEVQSAVPLCGIFCPNSVAVVRIS